MRRKILVLTGLALLLAGLVQFGGAVRVPAKAWLSVKLIDRAWARTLDGEKDARPWPWMDSAPVARLSVPRLNKSFIVMRGTSGAVLAFAPGWNEGTAKPGTPGISLISAHRDTHFGFLNQIEKGDVIRLETADARKIEYRVSELRVVMDPEIRVGQEEGGSTLLLTTSFPFVNWKPGGQMRFVVIAHEAGKDKAATT